MPKRFLLLLVFLASPAFAQSIIQISPQQCVWRAGDDPAWSAPTIDESAWQPNPHWHGLSPAAHIWVRCHPDLTFLRAQSQPALQVTLDAAYQLFLNGQVLGSAGNIRSGAFSLNVMRQYPLALVGPGAQPSTIALRITYRVNGVSAVTNAQNMDPPIIYAGDIKALTAQRAEIILTDSSGLLAIAFGYSLIGVLGLAMLGLFLYDRSRLDLLYLSLLCQVMALTRINGFGMAAQMNFSSALHFALSTATNIAGPTMTVLFFFALTRRRVPYFYWPAIAVIFLRYVVNFICLLLPVDQALWLFRSTNNAGETLGLMWIANVVVSTAPFVAFWPFTRHSGNMRLVAASSVLWGVADFTLFASGLTTIPALGMLNLYVIWKTELLEFRGIVTACVLIILLTFLFRDQRQITEERALLAGELHAASEIQRMLAPAALDCAPGLQIDVAFHPMREVGGDFYLCRILPDGTQRILIGDVSGKGSAAAMSAALLLGGATDRDTDSPAALLSHLNRVLLDSRVGGFATCLCADIAPSGEVILANAGHLPPYCEGEELSGVSGLPLGIAASATYTEAPHTLDSGKTLTLLSDGVVEARNPSGELFGFDRTRDISTQSAEQIAIAAKSHGQEDDITVLTLTFAPVGVAHA